MARDGWNEWVDEETVMNLGLGGEAEACLAFDVCPEKSTSLKDYNEREEVEYEILKLYSTDDARVWAESFVKKVKELYNVELDLDWVQGWFANMICVVQDLEKRRGKR